MIVALHFLQRILASRSWTFSSAMEYLAPQEGQESFTATLRERPPEGGGASGSYNQRITFAVNGRSITDSCRARVPTTEKRNGPLGTRANSSVKSHASGPGTDGNGRCPRPASKHPRLLDDAMRWTGVGAATTRLSRTRPSPGRRFVRPAPSCASLR